MANERRKHARKRVSLPLFFQVEGGERCAGEARDMGVGGAFVEADPAPAFGAKVKLLLRLPGVAREISVDGVVRWTEPGGMGVQFALLGARDTYAITEYLADMEEVPDSRFPDTD